MHLDESTRLTSTSIEAAVGYFEGEHTSGELLVRFNGLLASVEHADGNTLKLGVKLGDGSILWMVTSLSLAGAKHLAVYQGYTIVAKRARSPDATVRAIAFKITAC